MTNAITLANNDEEYLKLLRSTLGADLTDNEFRIFAQVCDRTQLDPFARQIFAIVRKDNSLPGGRRLTIQTSIDGFRLIAERSGKWAGVQGPWWCGPDGKWQEIWVAETPPVAAKVGVLRDGFLEPVYAVAHFKSYAQRKYDGSLMAVWKTMPELMIAKCAEALALRKAFPQELSGLYTTDEMAQADNPVTYPTSSSAPKTITHNLAPHKAQTTTTPPQPKPSVITEDGEIIEQGELLDAPSSDIEDAQIVEHAGYTREELEPMNIRQITQLLVDEHLPLTGTPAAKKDRLAQHYQAKASATNSSQASPYLAQARAALNNNTPEPLIEDVPDYEPDEEPF
jgi:phage recombination protein Bet